MSQLQQQNSTSVRQIFKLWLPLAVSFELMMLEGPVVQGAIGRLPNTELNLAAFGLVLSLSLLIESPVIMILATTIALVKDRESYREIRKFILNLSGLCTLLTALIAFKPVFNIIASVIMGQPKPIVEAAQPAMMIMLLWTAAIAYRRFQQGALVRFGHTRRVSWGTTIRLTFAISVSYALSRWSGMSGAMVGASALMAAVITEAIATTYFASSVLKRDLPEKVEGVRLSQSAILKFHAPLAATTLLTLLTQPLTSTALARMANPIETLAVWPVIFMIVLVMRGGCFAVQEITVAQDSNPNSRQALKRFAWTIGFVTSGLTLLFLNTTLLNSYLTNIIHLPRELFHYVWLGGMISFTLPLITALSSWARGSLVAHSDTRAVYRGMGINLFSHVTILAGCVLSHSPGVIAAAAAFTVAGCLEFAYLSYCARHANIRKDRIDHSEEQSLVEPTELLTAP